MKKGSKSQRDPQKLASQLEHSANLIPRNSVSSRKACSVPIHFRSSVLP